MSVVFGDPEWASEPVDGATLAAVAGTISQMAEAGKTEWFPRLSYETTGDAVSSVAVTVDVRVTLPLWSEYASASQAEKNEWDRFCRALRAGTHRSRSRYVLGCGSPPGRKIFTRRDGGMARRANSAPIGERCLRRLNRSRACQRHSD
jgi:Bacterial protein of unknown function (DUF922)